MFEELLIPVEEQSFCRLLVSPFNEEWITENGDIRFFRTVDGWKWTSNSIVPINNLFYPSLHAAKKSAFKTGKQPLRKIHRHKFRIFTNQEYYPLYNKNNQIIDRIGPVIGQSGKWTFSSFQGIYPSSILKDISPQQKYFKTKPEILRAIYQYLNNNLDTVYDEHRYQTFKDKKQIFFNNAWWVFFVKPEVELRNIF